MPQTGLVWMNPAARSVYSLLAINPGDLPDGRRELVRLESTKSQIRDFSLRIISGYYR